MGRLFESVYIALVLIVMVYYFLEWLDRKIYREVEDQMHFKVGREVRCTIRRLIESEILEPTKKYKKNPEILFEVHLKGKPVFATTKSL